MSTRSRSEDFDEYAPKWLREGSVRPLHPSTARLPNAPPLVMSEPEPPYDAAYGHDVDDGSYAPAFAPLERRDDSAFEGDVAIRHLRLQRSLEPELVAEPQWSPPKRPPLGMLVRTTVALGVATVGALAYVGIVPVPFSYVFHNAVSVLRETKTSASDARMPPLRERREAVNAASRIADSHRLPAFASPDAATDASQAPAATEGADGPRTVKPVVVAAVSPSSPWPATLAPTPSTPAPAVRRLDPEEIETLIRRGESFISQGDFSAARLMLKRAAEAGNARAAEMVAATYDARMLRKVGAVGVQPDNAQAREWYEKAAALGASDMPARIEGLPR